MASLLCGPLQVYRVSPPGGIVFIYFLEVTRQRARRGHHLLSPCRQSILNLRRDRPSDSSLRQLLLFNFRPFQKLLGRPCYGDLLVSVHGSATIQVGCAGKDEVIRLSRSPFLTEALGPTPAALQGHA